MIGHCLAGSDWRNVGIRLKSVGGTHAVMIQFVGADQPQPIPPGLQGALAPAEACLVEWRDYWVVCPGADRLQIGSKWQTSINPESHLFQVRFENELGLARLQPFQGSRPLGVPLTVEVVAGKFRTLEAYHAFLSGLLTDLFARAAQLPFHLLAATGRGVREKLRPPTPLFHYHWLCNHGRRLLQALDIVLAAPHRVLVDEPVRVPMSTASEADADVLLDILQAPEELVRAPGVAIARRLGGLAPMRVWQRRSRETVDTPANQFVKLMMRQVLVLAESLYRQSWWGDVPAERQHLIRSVATRIRQALQNSMLIDVQDPVAFPSQSQVLVRREGYRDFLELWPSMLHSRQPLFAVLQEAIDVRDAARLYEMWSFFALAQQIGVWLQQSPEVRPHVTDDRGLGWGAEARFGARGTLVYNRTYVRPLSYSVMFRPDFAWVVDGKPTVILDAKFRLDQWDERDEATARRDDLHKMHAYRDALRVRAALAVFPGDAATFHHTDGSKASTLRDALFGDFSGIGAVPLSPAREIQ